MYLLAELFFCFLLTGGYFLLGQSVLKSFRSTLTGSWNFISSYCIGTVSFAFLMFFLGIFDLYKTGVFAVAVGLPYLLVLQKAWRKQFRANIKEARGEIPTQVLIIFLAVFLIVGLLTLYPARGWDDTVYHLTVAKIFLKHGGSLELTNLRSPVTLQLNHMLFLPALAFINEIPAQFTHFIFYVCTVMALFLTAQRLFGNIWGFVAAFIFSIIQMVIEMTPTCHVDIVQMAFMAIFLFCFIDWLRTQDSRWVLPCIFTMGGAMGTKYNGLFLLPIAGMLFLFFSSKKKRQKGRIFSRNWKHFFLICCLGGLLASPWYIRNYILSGNPVFPIASGIFGNKYWSAEQVKEDYDATFNLYVPKTVAGYLSVPYVMSYEQHLFGATAYIPRYVSLMLFVIPLSFLLAQVRVYAAAFFLFSIIWFSGVQVTRHFLPILPTLMLLEIAIVRWVWTRFVNRLPFWTRGLLILVFAVHALQTAGVYLFEQFFKHRIGRLPVTAELRTKFYDKQFPLFKYFHFLNEKYGRRYTIFGFKTEQLAYFADGKYYGDRFGSASYGNFMKAIETGTLTEFISRHGITHVLVPKDKAPLLPTTWPVLMDGSYTLLEVALH